MAGKKQLAITERQFTVLDLLWDHGPLTVRDILAQLPGGVGMPYTTVLGLMQGMEKAGLVTHGEEAPPHRYRPMLNREEATRTLLGDFVQRFFRGSAERLVLGLVDGNHLTPEELKSIEEKLQATEAPEAPPAPKRKKP